MAIVAIIVGTFVFLLTGALIGDTTHDAGAGIVPGLVLGILAAYPIFKSACEERAKFQVIATENGTTMIRLDFAPTIEGVNYAACDTVITALIRDVDRALGSSISARAQ